jgi:hypothetical protein
MVHYLQTIFIFLFFDSILRGAYIFLVVLFVAVICKIISIIYSGYQMQWAYFKLESFEICEPAP